MSGAWNMDYLWTVIPVVAAVSGVIFGIALTSAKRDGKKLDAIRKERAELERQLRHLKPHLQ